MSPSSLEGRAVFGQGRWGKDQIYCIEEALQFCDNLMKPQVQKQLAIELQKRGYPDFGPLAIRLAKAENAVPYSQVLVPFEGMIESNPEPLFMKHPDIVAALLLAVLLPCGIFLTSCWWIVRYGSIAHVNRIAKV